MNRPIAALACLVLPLLVATVPSGAVGAPAQPPDEGSASEEPREPTALEKRAAAARESVGVFRLRSDQIHEWLREARRARYASRTACLDDTLSQSHALERQGDEAQARAERAAQKDDATGVDREIVRIQVLDGMSQFVLGSAQQCGRAPVRAAQPRRSKPAAPRSR